MLKNIRIILLETSHPGNIGACARAMKNMGLAELYLVKPKYFPHAEATSRAAHADDVLDKAIVCSDFLSAIQDCQWVVGCSATLRNTEQELLTPKTAIAEYQQHYAQAKIAFVFGRESTGLMNEELQLCHAQLQIPTAEYSSLNLAMAVQIICYELWLAQQTLPVENSADFASVMQHEKLYNELENIMAATGFYNPDKPRSLDKKIRHIFTKAKLTTSEMNVLMGFLASLKK